MSIHKLTAGSGYDYLTRQVAALDATEKGHTGLASYYAERGESPGVWIGSGMDGIEGLAAGDPAADASLGCGLHPLAELRQQQLEGPDLTTEDFQNVARLGAPFKMVDNDLRPFRVQVANRIAALNTAIGWPADASIAAADRARVRTQVAREFFRAEHGREPMDARELARPTSHTQDAPHSVQGTSGSARTNNPNGVPAGRPRPADSTPQSSNRGAQNMRLHPARWQDRQQHATESGSFRSRAGLRPASRRVSSLRCGPRRRLG